MHRPLDNVKIVVTRAHEQAGEFAALLEDNGATVIFFPTIEFREPADLSVIDDAINDLSKDNGAFDWVIFTSANGVKFFMKRLEALSLDLSVISQAKVGSVGPKTAALLKRHGVQVDLIPRDFRAEGLISDLQKVGISDNNILIPRALVGRNILPDTLRENGANVTLAPVYETVAPEGIDKAALVKDFDDGGEVILTFTSGSTVKNFFALFSDEEIKGFIDKVRIAVISPVTADVVKKSGYIVDIMPETYTAKDLADAIINSR